MPLPACDCADSFFDGSGYIQDVRGTCARLYQQVAGLRQQVRSWAAELPTKWSSEQLPQALVI